MNEGFLKYMPSVAWDAEGAGAGAGEGGDAGSGGGGTQYISTGSGGAEDGQGDTSGSGGAPSGNPLDALSALEAEDREWMQANGILKEDSDPTQVLTGLVKKGRETERLVGQKVVVPGPDASEEEIQAYRKAAGIPERADGYNFSMPADLPENLPYNSALADDYKGIAHKVGLTPSQATELHNWFARKSANEMENGQTAHRQQGAQATKELEQTYGWGPANSETYKANLEFAEQGARMLGGDELLDDFRKVGLMGPNGEVYSAKLANALSKAGRALASEDDGRLTGNRAVVGNPFSDEGNLTDQMKLVKLAQEGKQDPKRVRSMMMAAGKKPSDIGLPDSWGT